MITTAKGTKEYLYTVKYRYQIVDSLAVSGCGAERSSQRGCSLDAIALTAGLLSASCVDRTYLDRVDVGCAGENVIAFRSHDQGTHPTHAKGDNDATGRRRATIHHLLSEILNPPYVKGVHM